MKTIICLFAILLSAPCWAQDIKQPVWRFPDPVPVIDYEKTFPKQYEHKIIPEAELERWLNEGWELVKVYQAAEWTHSRSGVTLLNPVQILGNKAIIRRAKP